MQTRYELIISAVEKGVSDTFSKVKSSVATSYAVLQQFNKEIKNGGAVVEAVNSKIMGLVKTYLSFQGIKSSIDLVKESDAAIFKLRSTLDSANREFSDIGSLEQWQDAIGRMSDRLMVYSNTALRNAAQKTIELGSQLGLTGSQMQVLLERTGDLAAGMMGVDQASEIMMRGLMGQTRGLKELGIALTEDYIKAWYDAKVGQDGAFESLSNGEKVQTRYLAILEATAERQGRASEYAQTFAGAMDMVKNSINKSISGNKDIIASLNEVGLVLKDTAGNIGAIISKMIQFVAWALKFAAEHKNLTLAILGLSVGIAVIQKLVFWYNALDVALLKITGRGLAHYFNEANIAMSGGLSSLSKFQMAVTLIGSAIAALSIGWAIGSFLNSFTVVQQAAQRFYAAIDEGWSRARLAFLKYQLLIDKFNPFGSRADEIKKQIAAEEDHLRVIDITRAGIDRMGESSLRAAAKADSLSKAQANIKTSGEASVKQLDAFKKSATEAYDKAAESAQKYQDKIDELNFGISQREVETADKVREIRSASLDDAQKLSDIKVQALEKEKIAEESLADFKKTADNLDAAEAEKQASRQKKIIDDALRFWETYTSTAKTAYDAAISKAKELEDKNKEIDAGMIARQTSLNDKIREMQQRGLSDQEKQADIRMQAIEKLMDAEAALAQYKTTGDEAALKNAQDFIKAAESYWDKYGSGSEEATTEAINGLEDVAKTQDEIDEAQKDANAKQIEEQNNIAEARKKDIDSGIDKIKEMSTALTSLDNVQINIFQKLQDDCLAAMTVIDQQLMTLTQDMDAPIHIKLEDLEEATSDINSFLAKIPDTKTIHVRIESSGGSTSSSSEGEGEGQHAGGRVGMAAGGRFAGESKIDSIGPLWVRPGEGFTHNEALSVWDRLFGRSFFDQGINAPWSPVGQKIISALMDASGFHIPSIPKPSYSFAFATGGRAPEMGFKDMGKTDLALPSGNIYPVFGKVDVIKALKDEIEKERLMGSNG